MDPYNYVDDEMLFDEKFAFLQRKTLDDEEARLPMSFNGNRYRYDDEMSRMTLEIDSQIYNDS